MDGWMDGLKMKGCMQWNTVEDSERSVSEEPSFNIYLFIFFFFGGGGGGAVAVIVFIYYYFFFLGGGGGLLLSFIFPSICLFASFRVFLSSFCGFPGLSASFGVFRDLSASFLTFPGISGIRALHSTRLSSYSFDNKSAKWKLCGKFFIVGCLYLVYVTCASCVKECLQTDCKKNLFFFL